MKPAPIPENDAERVRALKSFDVLDTAAERVFDDIVKVAAYVLKTPIALVSLVDVDRQWFKARYGLDAPQTPRDISFCGHAVADRKLLVVQNALEDDRFSDNPLVVGDPRVIFYAGAPLFTSDGFALGTLCAIDHSPRQVSQQQVDILAALANQVVELLELRRAGRENAAYRRLLDAQLAAIANFDGYFTSVGGAWEKLLGYSAAEFCSRPYLDFVLPADVAATMRAAEQAAGGTDVFAFENRWLAKDGSTKWLHWYATVDIERREIYCSASDITSLRQAESELHESEASMRSLVDSMNECVISISADGVVETVNPAVERLLGYRPENLVGQNVKKIMPSPYRENHDGYLKAYNEGGVAKIIGTGREVEALHKNGTSIPVELSIAEVRLESGRRYIGVLRDLTSSRLAARELQRVNALKQAILDGAAYAIIATEVNGTIRLFNQAAESMLGYTAEEMVGKQSPAIIHKPEEVVRRAAELSEELGAKIEPGFEVFVSKPRTQGAEEREWTYIRRDGTEFPVLLSVSALRDTSGEVTGYLGIAADITERKAIQKMQAEFVSTVSHELRTPLTSIRGSLGLLAGGAVGELSPKVRDLIVLALNNCDRLVRLINDILDVERIQSGKMVLHIKDVDLATVLPNALAANQAYGDQFDVRFELATVPKGAMASADPDRLAQVMANLLSNAAKFSPQGSAVNVSAAILADRVRISVRDRGRGIPAEFKDRIFSRFAQSDASDSRQRGGTGLGLSITKALVEKMGGAVGFKENEGGGTEFWFELPKSASPRLSSPALVTGPEPVGSTLPILVVEDDLDAAQVLLAQVREWGYSADHSATIADAERRLKQTKYSVALLDVGLPDGNGLSLCSRIRAGEFGQTPPCIVVSARSEDNRYAKPLWMDWVEKPPELERLRTAVAHAQAHGGRRRVLVVEDDADCRKITEAMLQGIGIEVLGVPSAETALSAVLDYKPDLIILDIGLPGMSGFDLVEALKRTDARATPLVVYTGREVGPEDLEQLTLGVTRCLTKARVSKGQFLGTVQSMLAQHNEVSPG